jgi:phosphoribosylformylglycinamidine synthase
MKPRVLVLTGYGINCDYETEYAFNMRRVGGRAERVHVNDLIAKAPDGKSLSKYDILVIPGGFSYGDDIAAGKVLANKLRYNLRDQFDRFIEEGKLILGICNGFQVLVRMGLLPAVGGAYGEQQVTVTYNDSNKFEDRWVYLAVNPKSHCIFTKGLDTIYLPVRHGEGKLVARDPGALARLHEGGHVVVQYVDKEGRADGYPQNPNGSQDSIAGLCDPTGRIFGLMPHPEAYLFPTNHPRWTREKVPREGMGVAVFRNAVRYVKENR